MFEPKKFRKNRKKRKFKIPKNTTPDIAMKKLHAKFHGPRTFGYRDMMYQLKPSYEGEQQQWKTHPGRQNGHFLSAVKTEPS